MNTVAAMTDQPHAFKLQTGGFYSMTSMNIRFVATAPLKLQIKHVMKTSVAMQHKSSSPSLFQIADRVENFATASTSKSTSRLDQTPFIELMLHPEKLKSALKIAKIENDAFDASRTFSQNLPNRAGNAGKPCNHSLAELKTTEFCLEAPFSESVKLAADFTDWEKFPLDMIKSEDGVWHTSVPLPSGHYSYRFIVDGEWCDDPNPLRCHNNPSGRASTVVEIV